MDGCPRVKLSKKPGWVEYKFEPKVAVTEVFII